MEAVKANTEQRMRTLANLREALRLRRKQAAPHEREKVNAWCDEMEKKLDKHDPTKRPS